MAIGYHIDDRLVFVEFDGEHSLDETRAVWLAIERDPSYTRPGRVCVDLRGSTALARRAIGDLRANANWLIHRVRTPGRAGAFVVRPGLQYGLMRMVSTWLELTGVQVMVTTDPAKAENWLRSLDEENRISECG